MFVGTVWPTQSEIYRNETETFILSRKVVTFVTKHRKVYKFSEILTKKKIIWKQNEDKILKRFTNIVKVYFSLANFMKGFKASVVGDAFHLVFN